MYLGSTPSSLCLCLSSSLFLLLFGYHKTRWLLLYMLLLHVLAHDARSAGLEAERDEVAVPLASALTQRGPLGHDVGEMCFTHGDF